MAATCAEIGAKENDFKAAIEKHGQRFYTGALTEDAYWEAVLKSLGIHAVQAETLKKVYRSYVQPITGTLTLLPLLASQYTLITCNNSPKEWMDYRISLASLDRYFSKFFTSGYIGHTKPSNEMYSKVFGAYNCDIKDMLYIDDNEKYITVVRERYGLPCKVYRTPTDLLTLIR